MQKIRRFENLSQLEPMGLEDKFSLTEFTDESPESPSPSQLCSDPIQDKIDTKHTAIGLTDSPHDMFLGWEVEKNRQAYIRDMEKGGRWSKLDAEREEVALEVFASLMDEILLDLFS
ncbi:hypothetical protein Acr_18g0011600 [Actinidia rufa]|uniref:Uncharacterized protein n=1 Tax=Actinidia rufa TaxID=165716 RepID=A0A7J0G864_9ERIC|nr:hypothetical protein Acr_18g0011600 [Actinidia rufa]